MWAAKSANSVRPEDRHGAAMTNPPSSDLTRSGSPAPKLVDLHRAQIDETAATRESAKQILERVSALCATDFETAYRRFVAWRHIDPFPYVPPALLSSAVVCDYIVETGMLYGCPLNEDTVKMSSIDLPLLGKIVYWDGPRRKKLDLKLGKPFLLKKNSIAFVTLGPYIMLPDYLAMRFNFRVRNVYKGLLLGTGPLVDPGFQGRLSFPIHNLTNCDYLFKGGDGIIKAELNNIF
jgi:deoxycytidine triphosphate deaminase